MNNQRIHILAIVVVLLSGVPSVYASTKPSFTTQPSNATVTAPATATFTAVASGSPTPTYQWKQKPPGGSFGNISGATSTSYTTPATTAAMNGTQYECVATNSAGSTTSNVATLTVKYTPSITTQPSNATVTVPATASFSVVATGNPSPTYQWQKQPPGGGGFNSISGATSSSYTTPATTAAMDQTQYQCVVTNSVGNVTTNAVTLTVQYSPSITTQPSNAMVTSPAAGTFTVAASGDPAPSYQWQQEAPGAGSFTAISGATSSTYVTPATSASDDGTQFNCVVTNSIGNVTSSAATMTVDYAPNITAQPSNAAVSAPATATFSVSATGNPSPTYQWFQKTPGFPVFASIPGATSASYTTPATDASMGGTQYSCVVTNSAGNVTSSPATLTVGGPPVITVQPQSAVATTPNPATFNVVAPANPTPTYQWMEEAPGAGSFSPISGATSASYTTPATAVGQSGTQYECAVSNSLGSVTSNAVTLSVFPPPTANVAVGVSSNPLPAGSNLTITVTAQEYGGTISNVNIYNGTTLLGSGTSLTLNNIAAGVYNITAVATDGNGVSITSSPVVVYAYGSPTVSIVSPSNNSSLLVGSNLTVTATAGEVGGAISNVSFYNGSTLLSTVGTPPYTYTFNNMTTGTYSLTAVATDTNNVAVTSSPVSVTAASSIPAAIAITSPANNSTLTTGSLNITAVVQGSTTQVAFYDGGTQLNLVMLPANMNPYGGAVIPGQPQLTSYQALSYQWINPPPGVHILTAQNTDLNNAQITSAPVTVRINPVTYSVNVDDNIHTITDPKLNPPTVFSYDNLNRILGITFPDNSMVSYTYDAFGNLKTVMDQRQDPQHLLTYNYDNFDRLHQVIDPNGGTTQFEYDTNGNLVTLKDANLHETTYDYDLEDRVSSQTNVPLNLTTGFTYWPTGTVHTRTDANGKTTTYTYDLLNRLAVKFYSQGQVYYHYDPAGRMDYMVDDFTGKTSYAYDAANRLTSVTYNAQALVNQPIYPMPIQPLSSIIISQLGQIPSTSVTYTPDSEGNILTTVDQNGRTIANAYDPLNRLYTVTDPNGTTTYSYDLNSNETSVAYPNGASETYTYDSLNRVQTAVNQNSSAVISSFTNIYYPTGMIDTKTFQDGSVKTYTYDYINQLKTETLQSGTNTLYSHVYNYDPVGNRTSWSKNETLGYFWSNEAPNMPPQVLTNMTNAGYGSGADGSQALSLVRAYDTPGGDNRLPDWTYSVHIGSSNFPVQTDTYTYDNNGNRLTKQVVVTGQETPQQTSYSYDFENRLNALNYVNVPNIPDSNDYLFYNGSGQRVQAVVNGNLANYVNDGGNILLETDGSGNTTKAYTRGAGFAGGINGIISQNYTSGGNPVTQYYHYDDLGSVSNLTSSSGGSSSNYNYDAFGNLASAQASGDTNRYLFSTKELDSRSGLLYFGRRYYDPEIGRWLTQDPLGMVDGPNTYVYALNSPINYIDPNGLDVFVIGGPIMQPPVVGPPYWKPPVLKPPVFKPKPPVIKGPVSAPVQSKPIQPVNPSPVKPILPPVCQSGERAGELTCLEQLTMELAACNGLPTAEERTACREQAYEEYDECRKFEE